MTSAAPSRGLSSHSASGTGLSNRRGIAAMVLATVLFTGSDALVKAATASLPTGQIIAVRGGFALVFVLALVAWRREHLHLGQLGNPRVVLRSVIEATILLMFVPSLAHLPLANVTAILQTTPIIITLVAVVAGLERVGWRRWAAIVAGFAGVLLIVRPGVEGFNVYALITLVIAMLVAVRDLVTRGVSGHIPTTIVTLATTVVTTLAGLALSVAEGWRSLDISSGILLVGAALLVSLGNLAVVQAMRAGEVSVVSPFRYFGILSALAAGFVMFGEWPDALSGLGIGLIAASGVYALHRERARTRALA